MSSQLESLTYRTRRSCLLGSIKDGPQLLSAAQALVANASPSELYSLVTELTDYLASGHQADVSWLNIALAAMRRDDHDAGR